MNPCTHSGKADDEHQRLEDKYDAEPINCTKNVADTLAIQ
jgi:hypothetical protein